MVDCFNALHTWVTYMKKMGISVRIPRGHDDTSATLQALYASAYKNMIRVAGHRIGGSRASYEVMRDDLAREIEARFGTKPQRV